MQIQVKMKKVRNIDTVNDCEFWLKYHQYNFLYNMTANTGITNSRNGIVFAPYIPTLFNLNSLYPHIIKPFNLNTEKDEIKTQIKYRQFKRFRATGC